MVFAAEKFLWRSQMTLESVDKKFWTPVASQIQIEAPGVLNFLPRLSKMLVPGTAKRIFPVLHLRNWHLDSPASCEDVC